jgi:hypothetical protein
LGGTLYLRSGSWRHDGVIRSPSEGGRKLWPGYWFMCLRFLSKESLIGLRCGSSTHSPKVSH